MDTIRTRLIGLKFNMTPMIDIVFLLLVFLLATSRFRPLEAKLPMELPTPQAGEMARFTLVEPLVISLYSQDEGMRLILEGREFTYDDVTAASLIDFSDNLEDVYSVQRRTVDDPIELNCGDNLKWEHLVKFYNLMYGMGITNITFITD